MPIYTVEIDGKQYDLEGTRPPTETEARAAVASHATPAQSSAPPSPTPADGIRDALTWGGNVIAGMTGMGQAGRDAVAHPIETLGSIVVPGAIGKGLEAAGRGIYRGGVALLPRTIKEEFPNLAKSGLRESIALTKRGARKAAAGVAASADEADAVIARKAAERPRVAGLLPEGRVAVPLGATPQPTGGALSLQAAHEIQPRHVGPIGNAEELMGRTWSPVYGGTPTTQAVGDAVAGPGVVLRPMNAPPVEGRVPGMIALDDALAHVPNVAGDISHGALGANEPGLNQVRRLVALTRTGRHWPASLPEAQALKRAEQDIAHQAYKAADKGTIARVPTRARFAKAVAQGTREAIEREAPEVGPINTRTQELMGLERAAEHASGTGHGLMRIGGAGALGLLGSGAAHHGHGVLPGMAAAAIGATLGTPGGLTSLGLLTRSGGRMLPNAMRAALLAQLMSEQPPQQ